jgi:hypothetical protein
MDIKRAIAALGKTDPDTVFLDHVFTFTDFTVANIAFLNGQLSYTPYHFDAICPETVPLVAKLVQINRYGFISVNGQPGSISQGFTEKTWLDNEGRECGNWWWDEKQKPYICGFLHKGYLEAFREFMDPSHQKDYYCSISEKGRRLTNSFPTAAYIVTAERVHKDRELLCEQAWKDFSKITKASDFDSEKYIFDDYPRCLQLLEDTTVYVIIAGTEFGKGSVEDLLLRFFHEFEVGIYTVDLDACMV